MSIKITPDKYPQIIEVYNTEGKTAAYDLMRSCYEIKNPTCVMKRMKADKSLGYNYDTDRFESDSRKHLFFEHLDPRFNGRLGRWFVERTGK